MPPPKVEPIFQFDGLGPHKAPPPERPPAVPRLSTPINVPVMVPIPDGPGAAWALLVASVPDAEAVTRSRINGINAEIIALIETARLDTGIPFGTFLTTAARLVNKLQTLQLRVGDTPSQSVAAATLAMVKSISRWKAGDEIKLARAQLVAGIRSQLDPIDSNVAATCAAVRKGSTFSENPPHQSGLNHVHDVFLRRIEAELVKRDVLRRRLASIDSTGDEQRASLVRKAIAKAGGADAITKALEPSMYSGATAELAKAQNAARKLADKAAAIDPETVKYSDLVNQRETIEATYAELTGKVSTQRTKAAAALVEGAQTGKFQGIHALESAIVGIVPQLAVALSEIRSSDRDLVATVGELLAR